MVNTLEAKDNPSAPLSFGVLTPRDEPAKS